MDGVASMDCLPDDLIVKILSLLQTKEAVSTSVLSKRWRTLFASTHNLDFDDPIFYSKDIRKSFTDFVDSSLAFQCGKHIKKFSLKVTQIYKYEPYLYRWIYNALEHGVSELHLHLEFISRHNFPPKVFTSTTLVKLSGTRFFLPRWLSLKLPTDTSLPALKVLFLDSIRFEDDQLFNVFLATCPALEDLTIHYKYYSQVPYVISSKTIKKLSVIYDYDYYSDSSRIISLDIPNVVDLYYSDYPRHESPHWHLDSLAKATLNLHFKYYDKRHVQNNADLTNLISGICNVKTLHLTSSAVEVISEYCKGGLPMFNNLVELVFSSKKRGWREFLPLLLERSPNLKTLVLSDLYRYTFGRHRFVGVRIPPNNQVKRLSIMQYQRSADELQHIRHLLLNMECLEVLKVYVAAEINDLFVLNIKTQKKMNDLRKMQITEDMLKLPTASSKIEIQIM